VTEPEWLTTEIIKAIHSQQIAQHGGLDGVRDEGLLESALARPRQKHAYGDPGMAAMAAAYAFGIARNHPFIDGNKRTALMAAYVFLRLNGFVLDASEVEAVVTFQDLAAGKVDEAQLAAWIEANAKPV
jgi:death-on-curing protein